MWKRTFKYKRFGHFRTLFNNSHRVNSTRDTNLTRSFLKSQCLFNDDGKPKPNLDELKFTKSRKPKAAPLEGIKVLDLSRVLAGPYATQMLSDLGAEVIKIESTEGDITRQWSPPYVKKDGKDTKDASYFYCLNRNKKSMALNFKSQKGQNILHDLMKESDIVIENFRPGVLEKYNLGYDYVIENVNPDIIYTSISGFGQTGTMKQIPGFDLLAQGMGGLMSLTGEPDGEPQKVGVPLTDIVTALHAVIGILAELVRKQKQPSLTPQIDVSLFETALSLLVNHGSAFTAAGEIPNRVGTHHPSIVPYGIYTTQDRPVLLAIGTNKQFRRFIEILTSHLSEELPDKSFWNQYERNSQRVENATSLRTWLNERLGNMSSHDILALCRSHNIPCGPVNNVKEALDELPVIERGLTIHDGTLINSPLHCLKPDNFEEQLPPSLGEHTDEILSNNLHLSQDDIHALRQEGVLL